MDIPLELQFNHVEKVDKKKITELVKQQVDKLERYCDHIISCRVIIEQPQKHQQSGIPYRVRIDVAVPPNHEIVAKRDPHKGDLHVELPQIIRDTFNAMRRQLQKLVDRQHNKVKKHAVKEDVEDILEDDTEEEIFINEN